MISLNQSTTLKENHKHAEDPLDIVDDNNKEYSIKPRSQALPQGLNFRNVHIFIFNEKGQLLMQQIADGKRHPNYWGSSVAGYLLAGEDYQTAAVRKLKQELYLENLELELIGETAMADDKSTKFIQLFRTDYNEEIKFNPEEIKAVEYISLNNLDLESKKFTPSFIHLLDFYKSKISS